ncbi:MAG: hypothetical protein CL678_04425 [Bdellovibrionaceae bacterium]|nr:hypothetical protein [Pseudobdellovibrionaceae bacterium]|tara:strand:- start:20 stop:4150 length:4131 start_codon:yes stop_codon:yes gene_type:complete
MIKRKAFYIFLLVVLTVFLSIIGVIQSQQFATFVKETASQKLPGDLGITGDFSRFSVNFFPPGFSILDPHVKLNHRNILNLPEGSEVSAQRIDFKFYPVQLLTGSIRVHEASIVNGDVKIQMDLKNILNPKKKKKKKTSTFGLEWDQLFQFNSEAVSFVNTQVDLKSQNPPLEASFKTQELRFSQWIGEGGLGYELSINLETLKAHWPKEWNFPNELDGFRSHFYINSKGLEIDEVSFRSGDLSANVAGEIKGDLLQQKYFEFNTRWVIDGQVDQIAEILKQPEIKKDFDGYLNFSGFISGNTKNIEKTLQTTGNLKVKKAKLLGWEFENLAIDGEWLPPKGEGRGSLIVKKGFVESLPRTRIGGVQSGSGGRIDIGEFELDLNFKKKSKVPLSFKKAHLHWLAGPEVKSLFQMDFNTSGTVDVTFIPGINKVNQWKALVDLNLTIPKFLLDNQRLNKKRRTNEIVLAEDLSLNGAIQVDRKRLTPKGVHLSLPETDFKIDGYVDFKNGLSLDVDGPIDLKDILKVAESEIQGKGKLKTKIHGPSDQVVVDFFPTLENAEYLGLNLGQIKGQIQLDTAHERLNFINMEGIQGYSKYFGGGLISFDNRLKKTIDLNFKFPQGEVLDLSHMMSSLVKELDWYPRNLTGRLNGDIRIFGKTQLDKLNIVSDIKGTDWDYWGEKFRTVEFTAGYREGTYFLEKLKSRKNRGYLYGDIEFDEKKRMKWHFSTGGITINDLNHVARLDVPIRGNLSIKSQGSGLIDKLKSETIFKVNNLLVRGVPGLPTELKLSSLDRKIFLTGNILGEQAKVDCEYALDVGRKSKISLNSNFLDFSSILLLLNPRLIRDSQLLGQISGSLDLNFNSGKIEMGSGNLEMKSYRLKKQGKSFHLVHSFELPIKNGSFHIKDVKLSGGGKTLELNIKSNNSKLDGNIKGDLDIGFFEFINREILASEGDLSFDVAVSGTIKDVDFSGKAHVKNGRFKFSFLDSPISKVSGILSIDQTKIFVQRINGELGGGSFNGQGRIDLFGDHLIYPVFNLKSRLSNVRLGIDPFQYINLTGNINLTGDQTPYLISGDLKIDEAFSKSNFSDGISKQGTTPYQPPAITVQDSNYEMLKLDLKVKADDNVIIRNDIFDFNLSADLNIIGSPHSPKILGTSKLKSGTLNFKGKEFQVTSAEVKFDNPNIFNPKFNLSAKTEVNKTKINVFAEGTSRNWGLQLSSNPVLSEEDILNLLAVGLTPAEMARLGASDQNVVQSGEAASLVLHSTGFSRKVEEKTGFELQLDEAVNSQVGSSIFQRNGGVGTTAASPKIVVKRKIGKRVNISFGSTVGVGNSSQREVNTELEVSRGMSVIGVWNTFEGVNTQDNQTSYGVDLRVQKRFK